MTTLMKIEDEIKTLPKKELSQLIDWLLNHDNEQWDKQIAEDSKAGNLDVLAELAISGFKNKKYRTL
ncbi:MAG: hypothetical protein U9R26_06500 [Campylobacterota bacterium]|nr:hypothetical protein [Campylobacterota bacterium]